MIFCATYQRFTVDGFPAAGFIAITHADIGIGRNVRRGQGHQPYGWRLLQGLSVIIVVVAVELELCHTLKKGGFSETLNKGEILNSRPPILARRHIRMRAMIPTRRNCNE